MHFSKTYAALLLSLPQELRENSIEYRQLKKLINAVVHELTTLGLSPDVLHELLQSPDPLSGSSIKGKEKAVENDDWEDGEQARVVYEIGSDGTVVPKLRMRTGQKRHDSDKLRALLGLVGATEEHDTNPTTVEIPLPLPHNTTFFSVISNALNSLNLKSMDLTRSFAKDLEELARDVGSLAKPVSGTRKKRFHSPLSSDAGTLQRHGDSGFHLPGKLRLSSGMKTDLPVWRHMFSIYVSISPFESFTEGNAGERSLKEIDRRLKLVRAEIDKVLSSSSDSLILHDSRSREALEKFWQLNVEVLNVKKFQNANAEALRKILKKHSKRTALPLPLSATAEEHTVQNAEQDASLTEEILSPALSGTGNEQNQRNALILAFTPETSTLPRIMVQAIGERLLVVVPSIDDYTCLICTSVAWKPIRLNCGHLFCVRCLVKMQKRGQDECPICRRSVVGFANRSNVDWALLNFMQDWFSEEVKEKENSNEKEVAEEEMRELGIDPDKIGSCIVM